MAIAKRFCPIAHERKMVYGRLRSNAYFSRAISSAYLNLKTGVLSHKVLLKNNNAEGKKGW